MRMFLAVAALLSLLIVSPLYAFDKSPANEEVQMKITELDTQAKTEVKPVVKPVVKKKPTVPKKGAVLPEPTKYSIQLEIVYSDVTMKQAEALFKSTKLFYNGTKSMQMILK